MLHSYTMEISATTYQGFFFFNKHLLLLKSEMQRRSPLIVFYSNLFTAVNLLYPKALDAESLP